MVAGGNYTNTVIQDNTILGGFASDHPNSPTDTTGENDNDAIIKSVTEGPSILPSRPLNMPLHLFIGSVSRSDLELGSAIGTATTLSTLALS